MHCENVLVTAKQLPELAQSPGPIYPRPPHAQFGPGSIAFFIETFPLQVIQLF